MEVVKEMWGLCLSVPVKEGKEAWGLCLSVPVHVTWTMASVLHVLSEGGMASVELSEGRVTSISLSERALTQVSISLSKGGKAGLPVPVK